MADGIRIGNLDISSFKVGSSDCKVYLGDTLLYPTTPGFQGKWLATYSGGTTSSAECDTTSAITSGEITKTNLVSIEIGSCVTSIGDFAFNFCRSLTSIDIPDGVTSIGDYAFNFCRSLTSIDIPDSVTSIGNGVFQNCYNLTSCTIGSGVTSIGDYTFANCSSLTSIDIPDGVTSIGEWAFRYCSGLTSIVIPSGVTSIGDYTFANCSGLTSIDIPNSVTSIGYGSFYGCRSLTGITIPSGVTSIGGSAFSACTSLTSIAIPSSVTTIGGSAFDSCSSLTSCTIGNGVTTIGNTAFLNDSSITSIDIPSGVTSIGEGAFLNCGGLTGITVNATTPPTLGNIAFANTNNCPIYVPTELVATYKSSWSGYASRIQAIPTPTLQWVTFSNGDTIPSDLQIYGIKGIVADLNRVFDVYDENIYVENIGRNKYNVIIGGYTTECYNEEGILSNTSVEYTFSNIGCSDYYTVSSKTIANMSNDIQLYIYA